MEERKPETDNKTDGNDRVLKIKLEELEYDRDIISTNLEKHFDRIRSFRNAVYTAIAAIATVSTVIFQFRGMESVLLPAIGIILFILGVAVFLTLLLSHKVLTKGMLAAYEIERSYNESIYFLNDLRGSNIIISSDMPEVLPPKEYRIKIISSIDAALAPRWYLRFNEAMQEMLKDKIKRQQTQ